MIDLHTHILPQIDDGAKSIEMSMEMLRDEYNQGVETVVLTPHFYRHREDPDKFLRRRDKSYEMLRTAVEKLPNDEKAKIPKLILGCEVTWVPNLCDLDCLDRFCIGKTKNMLLELPFTPWDKSLSRQIYDLMNRTGITPILAHLDRYIKMQKKESLEDILSLDMPIQIGAEMLNNIFTKRRAISALNAWAHVIASDCHNMTSRAPCMGKAMEVVKDKLGETAAKEIDRSAYKLAGE